jgi:CubicO group peptidase (beta-lactamase class C family)
MLLGEEMPVPQPWGMGFGIRGGSDPLGFYGDLTPPGAFGHAGASGCVLVINPADGITIAYVSNRHLRAGLERFSYRLSSVINGVTAALTRTSTGR